MAKGGVFQALGNLWRWTIWGLAAILVVALWLGWSNRDAEVVAESEAPAEQEVAELPVSIDESAEAASEDAAGAAPETALEAVTEEAQDAAGEVAAAVETAAGKMEEAASEAVESTVNEVQSAIEGALGAAGEAAEKAESGLASIVEKAEAAVEQVEGALEGADPDMVPATELEEASVPGGAIAEEQANLNILSPEMGNITVPGDTATYALVSIFQRDDGMIEVVSDRTENGETTQTIRLVTCAPLAVGVISEGGSPRNDAPELERIPLGSAAATIAGLACGAMN
ncbi:hypothetical protein [Silicimonas sp. MF1-12-2]|uniref:hypothetical protein n=1 Tax=Silicimonas sp. MF1-12-2 TaxID=3384793 RepID=UPI0039B39472